nr:glycoside hydrolase family 76 protein [uncultured Arsenicibacter sp.]
MNTYLTAFAAACFSVTSLCAQPTADEYKARTQLIYQNIHQTFYQPKDGLFIETSDPAKNERPHSFLWPLCALFEATNEVERIDKSKPYNAWVMNAIDQYYNENPPAPGYQAYVRKERQDTRFYDDNQWIGITSLDAYDRTHDARYLELGKRIYRFMMTGFDTKTGGGIYWKEDEKNTKNTCSNGPGILIALHLYKITKQKSYLDTAILLYDWTNKYLLSPKGVYYDAIKVPSMKIDSATYTYNTGTMLQANALLYTLTKDKKYLTEAQRIAQAAEKHFFRNGKLPNHYWFNAVLLRGYLSLYEIDKNRQQLQFFINDAERIWQAERDDKNYLGRQKAKTLIDQAAMMEIYARLAQLAAKP